MRHYFLFCFISASSLLHALDTTEPFDIGVTDMEMAGEYSGGEKGELVWEGLIGAGLTERLSAGFAYVSSTDGYLNHPNHEFGLELFYTAVETPKFKFDIYGGPSSAGALVLGIEVNFDMPVFGIQLRYDEIAESAGENWMFTSNFEPLVYMNLPKESQLMAAFSFSLMSEKNDVGENFDIGAFSFGYNFLADSKIEILTQFDVAVNNAFDDVDFGGTIQLVATLPSAR